MADDFDAIDVVVLASGINKIVLYEGYEPGYKALIPFHGRASIHYVLDALAEVGPIRRICIEGPVGLLSKELAQRPPDSRTTLVEGGESFLDSLVIGLKHFAGSPRVLFVTADLPLVTPQAICDFLSGSARAPHPDGQSLFVSAVPEPCYTGPYQDFTKPFNRYRDVRVCHGNLFMIDPELLKRPELQEKINRFYAGRKNAVKTTLALGWKLAVVYMFGVEVFHALTIQKMAHFASQQLGFGIVPVLVEHPGISIDVDEADDYAFVRDRIEEQCR